jgi:glycosyltransferase involved in cell wall biosynthesis
MKLIFDYQIFAAQKNGGISRYFCNLIKYLKNDPNLEISLPLHHHNNEYLQEMSAILGAKNFKKIQNFGNFSLNFFKKSPDQNQEITKKILQTTKFDVLHTTYYDDYFLEFLSKKPFVITIHDMIHEIFPELFSLKDKTALLKKELALKADKIIVVSQASKRDLLKFIDVREEKISVIYQACSLDENLIKKQFKKTGQFRDYLLFVGHRSAYKNFYFMLTAIAKILKNNDLGLICFGAAFNKKEKYFIEKLGLEKKVQLISGSDYDLIGLYKNALCFIAPSCYEGFGVTVLEAFACGCPVLTSNSSAIPEAAGQAAIYFDPKDNIAIANAVEQVIGSPDLRLKMIQKGFIQNQLFSWPQIAGQMTREYQSIL